jgi:hypothetical protein
MVTLIQWSSLQKSMSKFKTKKFYDFEPWVLYQSFFELFFNSVSREKSPVVTTTLASNGEVVIIAMKSFIVQAPVL